MIILLKVELFLQCQILNFTSVGLQKCTVFSNPLKTNLLLSVLCSGQQDLLTPIFNHLSHSETRGPSEAGRTLLILVEAKSDLQMSADEVDKVEKLGREGESSEDIPASEEPELGLSDPWS